MSAKDRLTAKPGDFTIKRRSPLERMTKSPPIRKATPVDLGKQYRDSKRG